MEEVHILLVKGELPRVFKSKDIALLEARKKGSNSNWTIQSGCEYNDTDSLEVEIQEDTIVLRDEKDNEFTLEIDYEVVGDERLVDVCTFTGRESWEQFNRHELGTIKYNDTPIVSIGFSIGLLDDIRERSIELIEELDKKFEND